MAYYVYLFSPKTYEMFLASDRQIAGVRPRQERAASRLEPGDKLLCYLTKLSRWVALLEVIGTYYKDTTPRFAYANDPFTIRFKVKPLVVLSKEQGIPIHDDAVWTQLSFTRGCSLNTSSWTGKVRGSLNVLDDEDGQLLERMLLGQLSSGRIFEVDDQEYARFLGHTVRRVDKEVTVSVPQEHETESEPQPAAPTDVRESTKMQALLASVGAKMGSRIWIPRNNRTAVLAEWDGDSHAVLDVLPLNYDDTTLKTIEQIDVLWLKGRSIVRAFEVEHTTSIYSGTLRMADLMALQPNLNIKLHIVAPYSRRDKVFQELTRPVFSLLDAGPLYERCTYLSYDKVEELSRLQHLGYMSDAVVDDYAEEAE